MPSCPSQTLLAEMDERNSWGEVGGNTYDGYFEILVIIIKIIFFCIFKLYIF